MHDSFELSVFLIFLVLLFSPVLGFIAYWVFLLMKLGWGFGEFVKNFFLPMF